MDCIRNRAEPDGSVGARLRDWGLENTNLVMTNMTFTKVKTPTYTAPEVATKQPLVLGRQRLCPVSLFSLGGRECFLVVGFRLSREMGVVWPFHDSAVANGKDAVRNRL